MVSLTRTFHPIGFGAFYTECHKTIDKEINLKSATYWVSWNFACKTTKIHFIVHIPCITETS